MAQRSISLRTARRLAVTRQRLAGPRPPADATGIMEVARDLRALQLDPINVVARSHQLVLFSRLGPYPLAELDRLLWRDRALFEYWALAASIVLIEDYPLHRLLMRRRRRGATPQSRRMLEWVRQNPSLRRTVLRAVRDRGPIRLRDIEPGHVSYGWKSTGWTNERNVERMLDHFWVEGRVMVSRREGLEKLWDLTEKVLPDRPRQTLTDVQIVARSAQLSLRALGVATLKHIKGHFTRWRYPGLEEVLPRLERSGAIVPVAVEDESAGVLPGRWLVHAEDEPLLDRLEAEDGWEPRTVLLSPFDNLINDRERTEAMFGFRYRMEIYVPADRRTYGYYALPILHGDRFIGMVDAAADRARSVLVVKAVHQLPGAPQDRTTARAVRSAIHELATFVGAGDVEFAGPVPGRWRSGLT
jgi:uncharacterized protein YcaQ